MPILTLNNEPVHYQLAGDASAPVLVFSNSLGTSLALWESQAEYFSRHFRVLRYDTRGHGQSVKNKGPYAIDQLGHDVLALTGALGIQQFSFCGISMGGVIGQWLGVNAGHRLHRLVVCNTAAKIGQPHAWQERAALVRAQGMAPVAASTPSRWFTQAFVAAHPQTVAAWVQALGQTDPEGYAACCEALAGADLREHIQRITVPTLALTGTFDPVTTPADADFIAHQVPGAQRVDLPASHLSNLEAPDLFNEAVMRFLRG